MKKLITLLLSAGLLLGMSTSASAVNIEVGGHFQFGFTWMDNALEKNDGSDTFYARERWRPEFRFVADENLKGVLQLEIGTQGKGYGLDFGNGAGGMGADATAVKVKYAYVDWTVPGVDLKVRMGMQYAESPTYTFAPLYDSDEAGITLSYEFNDNVAMTLAWFRAYNESTSKVHDALDHFLLSVPVKGDGFVVNPWAVVATIGSKAPENWQNYDGVWGSAWDLYALDGLLPVNMTSPAVKSQITDSSVAWWLGIGGELSLFDPFTFAMDAMYGRCDFGSVGNMDTKREGFLVAAKASYKLDFMTPTLIAWYGSGDDANPNNGSERMPTIYGDSWATTFGQDGGWYDSDNLSQSLVGTWGLGLHFDNISFVENLTHNLRFTYYQGCNNSGMVPYAQPDLWDIKDHVSTAYMTTHDHAWEVNFENTWQMYKNLSLGFDLGYIKFDLDEDVWGARSDKDDKMYKAAVYVTYRF